MYDFKVYNLQSINGMVSADTLRMCLWGMSISRPSVTGRGEPSQFLPPIIFWSSFAHFVHIFKRNPSRILLGGMIKCWERSLLLTLSAFVSYITFLVCLIWLVFWLGCCVKLWTWNWNIKLGTGVCRNADWV